jgi:DNA-binding LytR/AlgR family response regulator
MESNFLKIKCIAIDPKKSSLDSICDLINKIPFFELKGSFSNPYDALHFLGANKIDLLFTEIEMPELSGIQLINSIKNRPLIIFVSASEKYAIEGYNLDILDYLLKPVTFERFLRCANKAYNELVNYNKPFENEPLKALGNINHDIIFVKSDYKIIRLATSNIMFIEGFNDYVKIFLEDNPKPVLSLLSLKVMEDRLPTPEFVRVHRSYIVSVNKINMIEKKRIIIEKHHIPISNSYYDSFYTVIKKMNICF